VIPAIVLAAGKSSRMGRPKALLPLGATHTFLSRIVTAFHTADVEDVIVAVGHDADAVIASWHDMPRAVRFVVNAEYETGQLSSLVAALRAIDRPGVNAALVTLVDVPLIQPQTIRAIVDRYRHTRASVVRPVRQGRHGHPVLIDRGLFDRICAGDPAYGAKAVIREHASDAGDVEVEDDGPFADVDTPEEYEALLNALRERSG
jgi:molybdenum cofactor cytidylyltransferase